jgi:hypothetical protein
MKKCLSLLVAFFMVLSLSVPAMASNSVEIETIDPSMVKPLELTLVSQNITPRGRVDVYSFYIPNSGYYYEVPEFRGEYTAGTHITVEGTWSPTYERLNVMFEDMNTGASVNGNIDCNEERTFGLWNDSEWGCFLKANNKNISGTLSIEVS